MVQKGTSPGSQGQRNPNAEAARAAIIFDLSEEFRFMFRKCATIDVLQLLRDNWQHYSQWIDGAHMKWQSPDFLESSNRVKKSLRNSVVLTTSGYLPLEETVLIEIDRELKDMCSIPALSVEDPLHMDWRFLSHLGVSTSPDIHYYLRCLAAVSKSTGVDVDKIAHIYEKIQSRYPGNEELIRYSRPGIRDSKALTRNSRTTFHEADIILTRAMTQPEQPCTPVRWINAAECAVSNIKIRSEYPTSSYLFQCLLCPSGDPITSNLKLISYISTSTTLEAISRRFHDLSKALKDIAATKASQLLRPLHDKPIFPVTDGLTESRHDGFDRLLGLQDTDWYIATEADSRESFLGKVPLLALPVEDMRAVQNLFTILRLEDRDLSKRSRCQTQPKGQVALHLPSSALFAERAPFIKA